jgi:hypothetical protein
MPHAVQLRSAELAAASRAAVNDEHWDREQRYWPMRKVERRTRLVHTMFPADMWQSNDLDFKCAEQDKQHSIPESDGIFPDQT